MINKWLTVSAVIHALLILPLIPKHITVPRAEPGTKAKTLIVSLIRPSTAGLVAGFAGSPGEQSDTFLPDDTCAWSPPNANY